MRRLYHYQCKRLFGKYVAVRDYNLKVCMNDGSDLALHLNGQEIPMIIPYTEINERATEFENDKGIHPSKYKGAPDYKNYYFEWFPKGI